MTRFPALAKMFSLECEADIPAELPEHLKAPIEILASKTDFPTAKENGKFLHSAYNPIREAESSADALKKSIPDCDGVVFFSCGLGYVPLSYAKKFLNDTIIIVENDPRYFFTALSLVDWTALFSHEKFIIALGTGIDSVVSLIEQTIGLKHTAISENPTQSEHSGEYFKALKELIERNKRKIEINASTLEKFSKLWLKNTCKNLHYLRDLDGITVFKDSCPPDLPVVILAAGPTLEEILPHLNEIKKRCLLIAVDTALRAALSAGVEPHFIVLTDPQYWAYRHIAGLSSPSSILITESAAYPAVFRFNCKKILMCASLFPLGQYIEKKIGGKGTLVAGGSVSTTAWEFSRYIGAKKIYFAGLDLGYPDFQTHIRGSTFEEAIHRSSDRFSTAEKMGVASLFGSNIQLAEDYNGNRILTDSKMKMFAWWFESKQEEFKEKIQTYSLSSRSMKIPGFKVAIYLSLPEVSFPDSLSSPGNDKSQSGDNGSYDRAVAELKSGLSSLYETAKKGFEIASHSGLLSELSKIDSDILHSQYKEIASLVFPTEKRLASLFETLPQEKDEFRSTLQKSRLIYSELMKGIEMYLKYLR